MSQAISESSGQHVDVNNGLFWEIEEVMCVGTHGPSYDMLDTLPCVAICFKTSVIDSDPQKNQLCKGYLVKGLN